MSGKQLFAVCVLGLGLIAGCSSSSNQPNNTSGSSVGSPSSGTTAGTTTGGTPSTPGGTSAGAMPGASAGGGAGLGGGATNPSAGTGGADGMMMAIASNPPTPMGTTTMPQPGGPMAMDECGLHTKYAGDEYCILPPPPDKGFQLHIGPSNYDNPEAQYLLQPGQELTTDYTAVSGNTSQVYFYYRQIRQRTGAHHNIVNALDATSGGLGHRIATSNLLADDMPKSGIIAPENMDVGIPLGPKTSIDVSLHSINTTQQTELREVWINFWYVDAAQVKEPVQEMFQVGNALFSIAPGQDTVIGPNSCTITASGTSSKPRMLWFYGHRHANTVSFSAWRIRGGQKDLFYEGTNWEEPLVLDYSSTVTNTPGMFAMGTPDKSVEGGWSGILDLQPGDVLQWQCHVINKTTSTLRFTNNTYTGEMCIMDAELVGVNCPGGGIPAH